MEGREGGRGGGCGLLPSSNFVTASLMYNVKGGKSMPNGWLIKTYLTGVVGSKDYFKRPSGSGLFVKGIVGMIV